MFCQRCITRDINTAQLEAVYAYSPQVHEDICNGLLDAVANSTINHSGHRAAAERLYRHGDLCVAAAPLEPLALPPRRWWWRGAEIVARHSTGIGLAAYGTLGFVIGRLLG